MVELHFQRQQAILAEIHGFDRNFLLKIPEVYFAAIFQMPNLFQIKPWHERIGGGPFRRDHHIMARLIPKIISKLDIPHGVFPPPNDFKILVQMEVTAWRFAFRIAQHGNNDFRA